MLLQDSVTIKIEPILLFFYDNDSSTTNIISLLPAIRYCELFKSTFWNITVQHRRIKFLKQPFQLFPKTDQSIHQ